MALASNDRIASMYAAMDRYLERGCRSLRLFTSNKPFVLPDFSRGFLFYVHYSRSPFVVPLFVRIIERIFCGTSLVNWNSNSDADRRWHSALVLRSVKNTLRDRMLSCFLKWIRIMNIVKSLNSLFDNPCNPWCLSIIERYACKYIFLIMLLKAVQYPYTYI